MNTEIDTEEKRSFEAALEDSIDDLEDIPEMVMFPTGTHKALLSLERKEINDEDKVMLSLAYVETVELANPEDEEDNLPKPGDISNLFYSIVDKARSAWLKKDIKEVMRDMELKTWSEALQEIHDIPVIVTVAIKTKHNKKTKETYTNQVILKMAIDK